jgi:lysophospholipase L1-like esterase
MRRMHSQFFGGLIALALAACAPTQTEAPPAAQTAAPMPAPTRTSDIGIAIPAGASEWFAGHYTERVLLFHNYPPMNGGVAFVGDSITEGHDWNAAYPDLTIRNYGIGGDTTIGLAGRLQQIVAARPAKIFLLIGTNDLGNANARPADIVTNYALVLDRLARDLPNTKVYMQTVFPREPRNAQAVREINDGLRALAAQRQLTLVDIYTPFAVDGGRLDPSVTQDDLHLTPAGYARWRTIIDPLVRE